MAALGKDLSWKSGQNTSPFDPQKSLLNVGVICSLKKPGPIGNIGCSLLIEVIGQVLEAVRATLGKAQDVLLQIEPTRPFIQ